MSNFHSVWCEHRESEETHNDKYPFCLKQIHGVDLIAIGEGSKATMWVSVTAAAHPDTLTSQQRPANDHQYNGIEIVTERYDGQDWTEEAYRLTSDSARSLAAALIRAADIHQGLTR